ncbi:MAG: hypothetical protein KA965_00870 [Butyrivibrio sp.]|nr:hypothetical protein [Butyrivibrio sp.]
MKKFGYIVPIILIAAGMLAGCSSGQPVQGASSKTSSSVQASSAAAAQTSAQATAADSKEANEVQGVIIDASMNQVTIQTTKGTTDTFMMDDQSNTSGLTNGMLLGHGIDVTFSDENKIMTLVSAKDADTKTTDYDALTAAGDVILTVESKNLDSLKELCTYPVHIGLGKGKEIKSGDDFSATYQSTDIYTDQLVTAVSSVNLMNIEITEKGLVLSENGSVPNIVLNKNDKGIWQITAINY